MLMTEGTAGKIHVPYELCLKFHTQYICEDRGEVDMRGRKMHTAYIVQRKGTTSDALSLNFLPPLFTTLEKKLGRLKISAEMQTKDQVPEHPFKKSGLSGSGKSGAHAMLLRKSSNQVAVVRPSSPVPKSKHHLTISPVVQQAPQPSSSTWPEQMENLFTTNISGTAKERGNHDFGLVVNRDFFSKWTLRYYHDAFEKQYHLYRSSFNNKNSFTSALSGVILNIAFGLMDVLLAPHELLVSHLAIIRFGAIVPATLIVLFIVRFAHEQSTRWIHFLMCFLAGISAFGVLACACFAHGDVPQPIFSTQYALVIMYAFLLTHIRFLYFATLYSFLLVSYIIVVAVEGGAMVKALPWGLLAIVALGGIALVASYKMEQMARTEWLLITMGEQSKRNVGPLEEGRGGIARNVKKVQKETVVGLLGNILPQKVIQKLKGGLASTFAEDFPNCTVMFVTLHDFATLFDQLSPTDLVETVDTVFSGFDDIVGQFTSLEKVKTIGEVYMVVGGASDKDADHAQQMVDCAMKMMQMTQRLSVNFGQQRTRLSVRAGIHSGLVHSGLIGWAKMIYDMWGETVNIAGLCTVHGMKDSVQITNAAYSQLHTFNFHSDPSLLTLSPSATPLSTFILTPNNDRD
eukprot:Phypoly_transcript_01369.p1 GENE.Phypoly_transcript_01369~~Phypoly_transcript_01369.p1  ORF type:complete len:630 (+),score=88.04 Phypoly_transcript_01369:1504-3393(+)